MKLQIDIVAFMIIWNFLNTYHLQKYYFTVTSENGKNNLNALFKKALAIESHHPEEAIKYYNSIIDDSESFKNIQKITISAYHNKGVLLEKLLLLLLTTNYNVLLHAAAAA